MKTSIVSALRGNRGKHILIILSPRKGDWSMEWDPNDSGSVAVAEKEFGSAIKSGRAGYKTKGDVATVTREFDPLADVIVAAPMINGG